MTDESGFKNEILTSIPVLRAYARALCNNAARADDLSQETLMRAWAHRDSYTPNTNMRAWLFTIARNSFYSDIRRRKREVEDPDGLIANSLAVQPNQHSELDLKELQRGLAQLPSEQREAVMLVAASGCTYEEAAMICGCAVGTIKRRVSRARRSLLAYLEGREVESTKVAESTDSAGARPAPTAAAAQ
jgi:RNA polymerase sigma-70 factor, ECF subfamily